MMKKFWIIKHAPELRSGGKHVIKDGGGRVYETKQEAIERAKHVASSDRKRVVVLEAVAAFEPPCNVVEVVIEDEGESTEAGTTAGFTGRGPESGSL